MAGTVIQEHVAVPLTCEAEGPPIGVLRLQANSQRFGSLGST